VSSGGKSGSGGAAAADNTSSPGGLSSGSQTFASNGGSTSPGGNQEGRGDGASDAGGSATSSSGGKTFDSSGGTQVQGGSLGGGGASGGISASGGGSTTGGTAGGGTAGTSSRATGSAGGSTGVGGQQAACGSLAGTDIWKLPTFQVAAGPYKADWKALGLSYSTPQWWRDAKLGAWAHWDPQSMPEHRRFKRHYAFMSDKNHYVACTRLRHQTIPLPRNEGIDHEGRRVARRRSPRVRWADLGQGYDLFFSRFPSMRTAETRQNPWSNRRFVTARIGRGAR
jgi:hypothetical protein